MLERAHGRMCGLPGWPMALSLAAVISLSACGGSIAPGGDSGDSSNPTASPTQVVAATPSAPKCPREVVRFVNALVGLDSRLDVGLNFQNYGDRVGDARVAYDRIDVDQLGADCINDAGVPAERAMNLYIEASSIWNDCIGDINCSNDDIRAKIQRKWALATRRVERAKAGLE